MRNFMTKCRGLWFLAIFALVIASYGVAFAEASNEDLSEKEVLTTLEQRMRKKISVDFRNTPIEDVIRIMADQADVDIVTSPQVTGNVTATLTNVPLEEALNNILAAHGFDYVATENMIRIAPAGEILEKAERLTSKIYRITYADVTEIEKGLSKFISTAGVVSSNPGTSNIIVTDTEAKIKAIDTFIEEIDRITPQVLVEARIYDISSTDRFELGVEWFGGTNTDYAGEGGDGTITSVGTNPIRPGKEGGSRLGPVDDYVTLGFDSAISGTKNTTGLIRFGILTDNVDIDAMLTANQENICAKLLASPRVLVLDNETATFEIIKEIPYQQLQQGGLQSFGTTEFKDVGVTLNVTPHIARDGMVRLHIQPTFSVVSEWVVMSSIDIDMPQPVVDKRVADTKVLIQDGQTVVLGGLRKKNVTQSMSKIPLLGDIPFFGQLFRFEGEETVNSELVVFVTPRIVIEPTMSVLERQYFDATETETCLPECPPTRVDPCFE